MRLKHFLSVFLTLLTLSVGQMWGACYLQSFNGSISDASTNFSTQNVASGSAGRVSWTTSGVTYSSNNFQMGANSSMTISVSSGYVITKVETSTTTGSTTYYGSLTSSTVTPTVASQKNYTFSNINASSITINNGSTTYRITSNGWVKVYYEASSSCTDPSTLLSISSSNTATVGTNKTLTTSGGNNGTVTWTVANGTGSATVSDNILTPTSAGTVTVTATQDDNGGKCGKVVNQTITISKASATITLSEAGATRSVSGTHYGGDSYSLPTTTTASCGDKVLVGWSKVEVAETDTKPTSNYYDKGTSVTLTAGSNTFYAVFAVASGTPESWDPVTSAPSDWSGDYVIVNPDKTHAMTSDFHSGTSGEFKGASVTITNNKVVSPTDKMIWTVAKNGNNNAQYSFKNKSAGTYAKITGTSSTNAALDANAVWFTIESTGTSGVWDVASVSNSARCFAWYPTNNSFRTYAKSSNNTGYLYKKSGGTTYSNYATFCCEPLAQIKGSVNVTNISRTGATVSWPKVANASGYEYKLGNGNWTTATVADLNNPSTSISGLQGATQYSINLRATGTGNVCSEGPAMENAVQFKTLSRVSAVENNDTYGTAKVSLTNGSGWADFVDAADGTTIYLQASPTNATYTFSGWSTPSSGSISEGKLTDWSGDVTVTANFALAELPKLPAPTGMASTVALNSATVSWDAVANATGYTVTCEKTSDHSTTGIVIGSITGEATKSCTISGLAAGTGYTWTVQAIGDNENYKNSDACSGQTFTTLSITAISVQTAPTAAYLVGDNFNPAGLVITRTFSNSTTDTYTYANHTGEFTFSPATNAALTADEDEVTITWNGLSTTQSINVYSVTVDKVNMNNVAITNAGVTAGCSGRTLSQSVGSTNYKFNSYVVTAGGVTISNNSITGTPNADVVINAKFHDPITVAWKVGDGDASGGTTEVKYGAKVTALPTDPANNALAKCGTNVFKGWSTSEITETGHSAPSDLFTSTSDAGCAALTENTIYHAVFAKSENGTSTVTFNPADVTNTPETSSGSKIWRHTTSGVQMRLYGSSSRYTDASPNTWTMSHNKGSYTVISAPTNITQITARSVYQYKSGSNTYTGWIKKATPGTLSPTSFTQADADNYVDQTISNINATSVTLQDNSSAAGDQARVLSLTVTYATTNISDYMTNCCTELDDINGAVTWSDAATAVLTWDDLENVDGTTPYNVTYRTGSAAFDNTNVGSITTNAQGKKTCSITGLTPCVNYDFMITVNPAEGYCEKDQTINDSQTHAWGVSFPTLTGTTKKSGDATSCATGNYVATFEAVSAAYELPTSDGVTVTIGNSTATLTTDYTWAVSEGVGTLTVLQASITGNIAISVVGVAHTCTEDPVLGDASLSGTFNLSTVGVSCEGIEPGSYCAVESGDYGFIWYAGTGDKEIGAEGVTKVAISTGDYSSGAFAAELSGTFTLGTTYTFRAFAENTGSNVGYSDAVSFTPRSVTFNKNNGEDNVVVYVNSGSPVAQPSNPSKTGGYEFAGWKLGGSAYNFSSEVTSNITLDAAYNALSYDVTLKANGGSGDDKVVSATYGLAMPLILKGGGDLTAHTKQGHTLLGYWDATSDGNKYYNYEAGTLSSAASWNKTSATDLYARWQANVYQVSLDNQGATVAGATSVQATYGQAMPSIAENLPSKTGYVFGGYYSGTNGSDQKYYNANGTSAHNYAKYSADPTKHVLYAYWIPSYTVTWSVNGITTTEQVVSGEKVAAMHAAPTSSDCDDAKVFVGWRAEAIEGVSATNPGSIFTTVEGSPEVTDDVTFFAVFADVTGGNTLELTFPDDNSSNNKNSSYGNSWTATKGDYSWSIENFNNNSWNQNWAYIKCGHNNNAYVGTIATSQVVPFEVDSVIIDMTVSKTSNLNSATLYISSNSDFSSSSTISIPVSGDDIGKIGISSSAEDKYYKIAFDCKAGTKANVVVNSVTYKQNLDTANFVTKCASCDDPATFTNTTPAVSEIGCTGATVTATGGLETLGSEGCNISDYGFVIGTSENPEIDGEGVTKLQVGTANPTIGADFSYDITGLTKGTQYNVRAYAVNKYGTAYSSNQSFWTKGVSSIAITTAPTKTNYIVGETFDATGMEVTATLAGGATEDITEDATYSNAALTAGVDQDFTISYTLCETEKTATQKINVYSVTVEEGENAENGEMSYDNAGTITVSNLAGHTTVSLDVENATIQDNGNGTFSIINPTGIVTVTVNYIEAVQVAVKYYVNGNELTGLAKNPYQSESFDMPDASAVASAMSSASINVGDVNFVGWSTTDFPYQTTEPTLAGASVSVTEATNYYAVFTNVEKTTITPDDFKPAKTDNEGEKTIDGVKYNIHEMCKQTGIQFSKNGYLYTIDALKYIRKVVVTGEEPIVYACSDNAGTTSGSAITPTGSGTALAPFVYTFPADKQYLKMTDNNGVTKPQLIEIYYAPEAVYYTTQFSTLTFKKANGTTDKTIQKATNDTYALTNADVPAASDTPEDYTFLNKWFDGTDTYAKDAVVTLSSDIVLKPCWDIEINDNATVPAANVEASDITVNEGKTLTLTLTEDTKLGDIFVENGGTLTISGDNRVDAKDFYIEAQEGYSGQVKGNGTIAVYGQAYYDLTLNPSGTMDNSKWYAFAVPFQVDAATGIQRLSNDGVTANAGFNSHYRIKKYDTAKRLSTGKGWVDVTSGETLYPGHFYMISLNSNVYNRLRMTKKAGADLSNIGAIDLVTNGTGTDANWNALANNALAYVNLSATGANEGIKVQTYRNTTDPDGYDLFDFGEITLTVGTPFFVQAVASAVGGLNVAVAATNNETVKAPAREAVATEEFQLRLGANTESYYDKLYVSASEEALNEYQIGHDLQKAGVSTTVPQMYVPAYGTKLCDAEFPLVNNEATFPLTFTAPNAGTYQLYVAKAAVDADLYLTYEGSIIWNLSMGEYELDLNKGTTNGYGLLLQAKAPSVATGVDQLDNGDWTLENVQKVIIDEHVFILRGGQMYDVTGKMVK